MNKPNKDYEDFFENNGRQSEQPQTIKHNKKNNNNYHKGKHR